MRVESIPSKPSLVPVLKNCELEKTNKQTNTSWFPKKTKKLNLLVDHHLLINKLEN